MPPDRLVTDSSLELVARRLRVLGFDVTVLEGARLEDVFEQARRDGRIVLTSSARHPRRFGDVRAIVLPRDDPATAVRRIAGVLEPAGRPFSRCARCNHPLERRAARDAVGQAPEDVRRGTTALHHCPGCGRWYWHGSHVDRLRDWLRETLGREIDPPAPDGESD